MPEEVCHALKLRGRICVPGLDVREVCAGNQHNLLLHVVKCNHLVKKHHIHIAKAFRVLGEIPHNRLAVAQVIVGPVAHQAAREGRKLREARASEIRENASKITRRVVGVNHGITVRQLPVYTRDGALRLEP